MATQTCIEFPDTCPYCKGRGVEVFVYHLRNRIVESVQPCKLCNAKGILPKESFKDYLYRKLAVNSHLYGKFPRS